MSAKDDVLKEELIRIFTAIDDPAEMAVFFREILTEKEIADLALRWQLLRELHAGETQREIARKHGISLCKITRGAKILKRESAMVRKLMDLRYGKGRGNP